MTPKTHKNTQKQVQILITNVQIKINTYIIQQERKELMRETQTDMACKNRCTAVLHTRTARHAISQKRREVLPDSIFRKPPKG